MGNNKNRSNITTLSPSEEFAATAPEWYTFIKAIDPTGVTGYGDVYDSMKNYDSKPSLESAYDLGMEAAGAFPLINKGKLLLKTLQGVVTGRGAFKDYEKAKQLQKTYDNELVIDYFDNVVKARKDAEANRNNYSISYTDINHLPSYELAPNGYNIGDTINNYNRNSILVDRYKNSNSKRKLQQAGKRR